MILAVVAAAAALAPAQFPAQAGWQTGAGRVHACPGVSAARCQTVSSWAATVRRHDCVGCFPQRTTRLLRPDDIAIELMLSREKRLSWMKPLPWPPPLAPVTPGFEGIPQRIGVFQRIGRIHGFTGYVFVFFGRRHPTAHQRARARAELAAARLPSR